MWFVDSKPRLGGRQKCFGCLTQRNNCDWVARLTMHCRLRSPSASELIARCISITAVYCAALRCDSHLIASSVLANNGITSSSSFTPATAAPRSFRLHLPSGFVRSFLRCVTFSDVNNPTIMLAGIASHHNRSRGTTYPRENPTVASKLSKKSV
jgi:hypothetical protein